MVKTNAVRPDAAARADLLDLRDLARIGKATETIVVGDFREVVSKAPLADMDIMGLPAGPNLRFVAEMVKATRSSCLFPADSGWESAIT